MNTKRELYNHLKVNYASLILATRSIVIESPASRGTHFPALN